jgi:hypothetical protein
MSVFNCQIMRGFFILRPCGREGVTECQTCGKYFCHRCRSAGEGHLCIECGAKKPKPAKDHDTERDWESDRSYSYRHRHSHYGHHGYAPLYWGHHHSRHDHDHGAADDSAGFDPAEAESFDNSLPAEANDGFEGFEESGDASAFDS